MASSVSICGSESLIFTGSGGQSFQFFIGGDLRLTTNSNSGPASANFNPTDFGGIVDGDEVTVKVYNKVLDGVNPDPTACSSISSPVTVSINPVPNASISSDKLNDIICDDESFKLTATAGGIAGASYEFSINGVFSDIVTATSTETSVEFSPTAPFTNSILVSVKVTTPSGCSSTTSLTMIENIINSPGTISGTQSVCFNAQPAEITGVTTATALSGSATITYQWQSSPIANFSSSVTTIIGATSENYTPNPLSETTYFRRLAVSTLNSKACTSTTDIVEVEVKDGPGGTLVINGENVGSKDLCPGDNLTLSITGIADAANKSFEYRRGGVVINTSSSTSFEVPNPSGTANYSAYVYDMPLQGNNINPAACRSLTNSIVITMADEIDVQIVITNAINNTFCDGDNIEITASVNPAVPVNTYSFKLNNVNQQTSASDVYSSTTLPNSANIEVVAALANGCSFSSSVTLVKNEITSAGTITGTQIICNGEIPQPITSLTTATTSSASATITYSWESSTDGVSFTTITGQVSQNYSPGPLVQTTLFRRAATSKLNDKECSRATAPPVEVFVTNDLAGGNIKPDTPQILCFGLAVQPATLTVINGINGPLITYQWQESSNGVNNWSNLPVANGPSFVPPTLQNTSTIYYRRQTLANGGGPGCESFSDVHEIRVNDIQPGSIDTNSAATYCYGTNPGSINSITEATSTFGAINYQWQKRTDSTGWVSITGATNNNYDPGSLIEKTFFRRGVTTTQSGTTCFESSNVVIKDFLYELNSGGILTNQ